MYVLECDTGFVISAYYYIATHDRGAHTFYLITLLQTIAQPLRLCVPSTNGSHAISSFIMRLSTALALEQHNSSLTLRGLR
jgi:hypothetical protein